MIADEKRLKFGLRKSSAVVSLAAASTPTNVYLTSAGRTVQVRKIMITNRTAGLSNVQIGTGLGAGFAQLFPQIYTVGSGQDLEIEEEHIPAVETNVNITAQASAAGAAPADVQIQLEVEEYQGPTG